MPVEFLGIEDVMHIHRNQIERYGGGLGVRDPGALESALAQPQATFSGKHLHADLFEMAAAYMYHIVQNHPFLDGNKRTGAVTALTFLDWNGINFRSDEEGLADITLRVASGRAGKQAVAAFFRTMVE